jgi:N-acetylneuraminic acid mutarotase
MIGTLQTKGNTKSLLDLETIDDLLHAPLSSNHLGTAGHFNGRSWSKAMLSSPSLGALFSGAFPYGKDRDSYS